MQVYKKRFKYKFSKYLYSICFVTYLILPSLLPAQEALQCTGNESHGGKRSTTYVIGIRYIDLLGYMVVVIM